jgi:NAD(P)-dependent dehydrogenase (short-subunit alcohol dehydrogenase family)
VTGASSGIGRACAEHLHRKGHRVFGGSRRDVGPTLFRWLAMDVTDDEQVRAAVATVFEEAGRLDVLINCAGAGLAGAVEDTPMADAIAQMDLNFFGTVRACLAVLPAMRRRERGQVVNVSSLAGLIGLPFQSYYSASKFALEGWSEALRREVAPFGVRVTLIEPGDFRTGFTDSRRRAGLGSVDSPYRERCEKAIQAAAASERAGAFPESVATLVEGIVKRSTPRSRYTVGPRSQRWGIAARHLLPASWFEWGMQKYCGT